MTRIDFHNELLSMMPVDAQNVYYQAPPKEAMKFPCIVYGLDSLPTRKADNLAYNIDKNYKLTYISKSPSEDFPVELLKKFPKSTFITRFVNDGLYHNVFQIYS